MSAAIGLYIQKNIKPVSARQHDSDVPVLVISEQKGQQTARKNDWLVGNERGKVYVMSPEAFAAAFELAPELALEPVTEPVVPEPTTEPVTEPITEPIKPVTEPVVEPVVPEPAKPVTEPVTQPATEPHQI
jgi:hypothetical protein